MFEDELFRGIDPSVTKPHPPEKLFAMAKELTQKYFAAEQRFTKSGQHENDFRNFVEKQGAVLYLRKWLKVRRNLCFACKCIFLTHVCEMAYTAETRAHKFC